MSNLAVTIENRRGGKTKTVSNLGYIQVALRHPDDEIVIDDFEGSGESYKQREMTEIRIYQNGEKLFAGSKLELFDLLRLANVTGS